MSARGWGGAYQALNAGQRTCKDPLMLQRTRRAVKVLGAAAPCTVTCACARSPAIAVSKWYKVHPMLLGSRGRLGRGSASCPTRLLLRLRA